MRKPRILSRKTAIAGGAVLLAAGVAAGCGPVNILSQDAARTAPTTVSAAPSTASEDPTTPAPSDPAADSPSATPTPTPTQTPTPTPDPTTSSPAVPADPVAAPKVTGPAIPVIGHTASGGRTVALTFDDGPGPFTPQILDVLAQYHVKATFCEIGQQAAANPALVQRVVAAGHRLCDHTVDHPQPMHTLPYDRQVSEIVTAKSQILQAAGPGARIAWFRAPGGDFTPLNDQIAVQNGLRPLAWTVDTVDWSRPGVPAILNAVQQELKPGGVILMHDGGGDRSQTVAALRQLIPWLISQGYSFDFPAA